MTWPVGLVQLLLFVTGPTAALTAQPIYSDLWAVEVEGGEAVARQLAEKHGFLYLEEVSSFHSWSLHCLPWP